MTNEVDTLVGYGLSELMTSIKILFGILGQLTKDVEIRRKRFNKIDNVKETESFS